MCSDWTAGLDDWGNLRCLVSSDKAFEMCFRKIAKNLLSFVVVCLLSVRPPARRNEQPSSHSTADFHQILYLRIFSKIFQIVQVSLKSDENNGCLPEDQHTFLIISLSVLFILSSVSGKSCRESQNTF